MTLEEALAAQPAWLGLWLNWMLVGAFFLPLALFIWKPTRLAAVLAIVTGILSALGVGMLYDQWGYVKLLGLPHILLWTPFALYLVHLLRRGLEPWPRLIVIVILATILISLAFDYTDALRYLLGNRAPLEGTVPS